MNRENLLAVLITIMLLCNVIMLVINGAGVLSVVISIIIGVIIGFTLDKFFEGRERKRDRLDVD